MNSGNSAHTDLGRAYPAKRLIDIAVASIVLVLALVPGLLCALVIKLTSNGSVFYWSKRIGRYNKTFRMPKFRTMRTDTPAVATHLMDDPDRYLIPPGRFLRQSSLDELPQVWSILRGDMSLVGPRPALYNQYDLVALRTEAGVDRLLPGLTGWAQVNGRDDLSIPDKVKLDAEYLRRQSFMFDMKIVVLTISRVIFSHGVAH